MSLIKLLIESVQRSPEQLKNKLLKVLSKKFKSRWYDEFNEPPKENSIDNFFGFVFRKYTPDEVIRDVLNADPTDGKYSNWIISVYLDDVLPPNDILDRPEMVLVKFYEDLPKVEEYLELFHKYKDHKEIKEKDINQYESLDDLYEAIKPFKLQEDTYTVEDMIELADSNEVDYAIETDPNSDWVMIFPMDEKSVCIFGVNTEWCTAWGEHSLNKDYRDRHSHYEEGLIILINKNDPNDKYQVHFQSQQFMDKDDHTIDLYDTFGDDPLVIEEFSYYFDEYIEHLNISIYPDGDDYKIDSDSESFYSEKFNEISYHHISYFSAIQNFIDVNKIDIDIQGKLLDLMEEDIKQYIPYDDYDPSKEELIEKYYNNNESFRSAYVNIRLENYMGEDYYKNTMKIIHDAILKTINKVAENKMVTLSKEEYLRNIFYYVLEGNSIDDNYIIENFSESLEEIIDNDEFYKELNNKLRKELK